LKDISMDDQDFAHELVRIFLEDSAIQLQRLRAAVDRADCREVAEVAHRLKGAAGNVGAEILAETCAALESAARRLEPACFLDGFAGVNEELAKARALLEREWSGQ
jgi:HPt (histidine-containing phosphotransfer) domain-containing protein